MGKEGLSSYIGERICVLKNCTYTYLDLEVCKIQTEHNNMERNLITVNSVNML